MTTLEIKVLLIEANPSDVRLLCETATVAGAIKLETVDCFADGIERLNRGGIDLILLDPALPDAQGCDTIERVHETALGTPIIVLSYCDDRELIQSAVQKGAPQSENRDGHLRTQRRTAVGGSRVPTGFPGTLMNSDRERSAVDCGP